MERPLKRNEPEDRTQCAVSRELAVHGAKPNLTSTGVDKKGSPATISEIAPVAEPYTPTLQEQAAVQEFLARKNGKTATPRIKVVQQADGSPEFRPDHPDEPLGWRLLSRAFGTTDNAFLAGLINQLIDVGSQARGMDPGMLNFMVSIIEGAEPRDQIEAMLAAQMAVVQLATMKIGRRLLVSENIIEQDSTERAFNKLARTFAVQLETLKRYRTGGEQKLTVQHVTVNEVGQAIVGDVIRSNGEGSS
jgi:hypothetical protein